ncbi:MAG: AhpC/TSA family protein [Bacteroidota bacterium]|nr:AhpC/TSA family protein [Bacteroidota bacterium]MDP3146579.1 AhpC/TSA family protein [Bacteroidota bacterium]
MKKFTVLLITFLFFSFSSKAQTGYDIKLNLKGCNDTSMYLVKYYFTSQYIVDSCKKVKNGKIHFKGKENLDKGVYAIVGQDKSSFYFQIFINEGQKFSVSSDFADLVNTLKADGSKENELAFSYMKYMTNKSREFNKILDESRGKKDSLTFLTEKQKIFSEETVKFEKDFNEKNKGSFICDFLNLNKEKYPTDIPKAKNGRPDSIYQYYYYKDHYFDGMNFNDDRIIHTPFFADRTKKYFESVIVQHPDTLIQEIDRFFKKCNQGTLIYNAMLGYFTYKFENNKTMTFDNKGNTVTFEKAFVHICDNYIINGKAKGIYSDETVVKIKEKVDIMRHLLPGSKVPDISMFDTIGGKLVRKMGFDTAKTSVSISELYNKNLDRLAPLYKNLYQVNAKYTILVFWAEDCGHCQTEIPKLNETLKELSGKVDYKVFAVQTKADSFDKWRKFVIDKKLDFINVYEAIPFNNIREKFDIFATPVIYILDKDKRIKAKKLGADQVVEIIKIMEEVDKKNG